jgi:predicted ArsR family transcriptional regulator
MQMLTYIEQDIVEQLVFHGVRTESDLRDELGIPFNAVRLALQSLERKGLVRFDPGPWGWVYCGGPVSDFFKYSQTQGVVDGQRAQAA